jgi:type III restriction enzyme
VDNTERAKKAIANLNPVATLRYSATHKNPYNLLYKLDPIKAYDLRLVKRIEVASIRSGDNFNDAYVKLLETNNKDGIQARLEIHKEDSHGHVKTAKVWVKQGDDLHVKSGHDLYQSGYQVRNIDATPGAEYVEFNQGRILEKGQSLGGMGEDLMKAQVRETVEQHLKKERALRGKGIKVLSLFFIDKVSNYRVYNEDGTTALGKIGLWFEEALAEFAKHPLFKDLETCKLPVDKVHNGYFSQDRKAVTPFGEGKRQTSERAAEEDTFNLIMRDKERLLDAQEPLRFIFSHSALREGWDNPNVFQICTLNETDSADKKRQEIGRGLRLPVNDQGERVYDETVNRLTVIANESYEDFARKLQNEFEEDYGIKFGVVEKITFAKLIDPQDTQGKEIGQEKSAAVWDALHHAGYIDSEGVIQNAFNPKNPLFTLNIPDEYNYLKAGIIDEMKKKLFKNRIVNARDRQVVKFNKQVQLSDDFKVLWDKIKHRTRYKVEFKTEDLIAAAVKRIKDKNHIPAIRAASLVAEVVGVDITEAGVSAERILQQKQYEVTEIHYIPDILAYLQKETELTRDTLVKILTQSGRLGELRVNPQAFMAGVGKEIARAMHDLMLDGIQYEKIAGNYWEMSEFEKGTEDLSKYLNNLYEVQNKEKSLYDWVEFESEVERQFARDLDNNVNVRLFIKLPAWFKIDTPIGTYNPDWAFMTETDEKLYFVRETKSTLDSDERRTKENQKIRCGQRHFETIGVDYAVVTNLSEVAF